MARIELKSVPHCFLRAPFNVESTTPLNNARGTSIDCRPGVESFFSSSHIFTLA